MTIIIDGLITAQKIKNELKKEIKRMKTKPGLAVVLVGSDQASKVYIRNKQKACEEVGINSFLYEFKSTVSEKTLLKQIDSLNKDKKVHGILLQLPIPKHINEEKVLEAIDPRKDVDCFHPVNVGKFCIGQGMFEPCTPAGIIELLKRYKIEISGKDCVVIGRSNIVGKPMGTLLLKENGTVTICHSQTKDVAKKIKQADIVVSAIGQANFIKKEMIKRGAVVIDVGINRSADGKLCGDVDFENVKQVAEAITPVPGGVGPMTVASLLKNCVKAAKFK
jgi:methylenetetrahydrofolate dehydrogenase (NADP+) / methenyltetrahydrofolate cyclohydrolase